MEFYQLRYVLMLAREKNFSRAAERLFITQPTLSQQIKKFEGELGFPLFQRNTKGVALTAYGEQFVARAEEVSAQFEHLQHWCDQERELRNSHLSFGASVLSMPHVSQCIPDFLSQFPQVQFSYVEQWDPILLDMVRGGTLDIALVSLPQEEESRAGLSIFPVREEFVCVVVSAQHPLHDRTSVSLSDLAQEKIVSTSERSGLQGVMKAQFARNGLSPNFSMNLASIEARLSMVTKGAITFVMNEQFQRYNQEYLAVIPIEPKIYKTFALVTAANRQITVLERTFLNMVRDGILARLDV
jgi:DNA-binding transcriptional LysR family regulator